MVVFPRCSRKKPGIFISYALVEKPSSLLFSNPTASRLTLIQACISNVILLNESRHLSYKFLIFQNIISVVEAYSDTWLYAGPDFPMLSSPVSSTFLNDDLTNLLVLLYPVQLDFSDDLLFNRDIVHAALKSVGLDDSTLDIPYPSFDPLKALQSLRVAMLGSSAAMLAAVAGGTGSVNTPGGRASGASDYGSSTNRFSGWGTLPSSQGYGGGMDNTYRNGGQYEPRGGMANSQSMSSLSMDGSTQSVPNAGSASDLEKEEMISFKHAQQILYESPETRRRRKYAENMHMVNNFDSAIGKAPVDFNELCALHTERTQTQRFKMAEVFNDLSSELNRRKTSNQRRGSFAAPGLAFLRVGPSRQDKKDSDGGGMSEHPRRRTIADDNSMEDSSEWLGPDGQTDRDPLEPLKGEKDKEGSPGPPNTAAQSNWDSNFISLFVS
nr:hypothetical protein HmN_000608700 [Hymenolepis microstoma]